MVFVAPQHLPASIRTVLLTPSPHAGGHTREVRRLDYQDALVTGAGSGIGTAVASRLRPPGAVASQSDPVSLARRPEEVDAPVLSFAADAASFITGQVISVSSGLTMAG